MAFPFVWFFSGAASTLFTTYLLSEGARSDVPKIFSYFGDFIKDTFVGERREKLLSMLKSLQDKLPEEENIESLKESISEFTTFLMESVSEASDTVKEKFQEVMKEIFPEDKKGE